MPFQAIDIAMNKLNVYFFVNDFKIFYYIKKIINLKKTIVALYLLDIKEFFHLG
jgi:hypothetical protein